MLVISVEQVARPERARDRRLADDLSRLAEALRVLKDEQLGVGDVEAKEMLCDPTDPESLAEGGNFRVMTDHGLIEVMQWDLSEALLGGFPPRGRQPLPARSRPPDHEARPGAPLTRRIWTH